MPKYHQASRWRSEPSERYRRVPPKPIAILLDLALDGPLRPLPVELQGPLGLLPRLLRLPLGDLNVLLAPPLHVDEDLLLALPVILGLQPRAPDMRLHVIDDVFLLRLGLLLDLLELLLELRRAKRELESSSVGTCSMEARRFPCEPR